VDRLLHGGTNVLVDQIAQRHRPLLMRKLQLLDTVVHGVFLRWSPAKATGWWFPTGRMRHFHFPHDPGHDQAENTLCIKGVMRARQSQQRSHAHRHRIFGGVFGTRRPHRRSSKRPLSVPRNVIPTAISIHERATSLA
jgi:hypothetical protein